MVTAFLGVKVGAGVEVGAQGGTSKPEVVQVFLPEFLMEAQRAVKIELMWVQGLMRSNNAGVYRFIL